MGAVPVTINGVMYPKGKSADDEPVPCTIVGYAWVTGLGIGGGPVAPGAPPGQPAHPIVLPPEQPPPVDPPEVPPGLSPPPGWSWFYTQRFGWVLIWIPPAGGGKPQPPGGPTVTPHK